MHRPCLVVFGSLDRARTMFGSTTVTGYPGRSGPPWPGELVIGSHWGRGGLETGDYMLGTFRAHVHLSHNVTSG